jgi:hypothetical protein
MPIMRDAFGVTWSTDDSHVDSDAWIVPEGGVECCALLNTPDHRYVSPSLRSKASRTADGRAERVELWMQSSLAQKQLLAALRSTAVKDDGQTRRVDDSHSGSKADRSVEGQSHG